jgi:hypothetical protein
MTARIIKSEAMTQPKAIKKFRELSKSRDFVRLTKSRNEYFVHINGAKKEPRIAKLPERIPLLEKKRDEIVSVVSEATGVQPALIWSRNRKRATCEARFICMSMMREHTNYSLEEIGYVFSGKDHSTVLHAIQTLNDLLITDRAFKEAFDKSEELYKERFAFQD